MNYCTKCGTKLINNNYCPRCGHVIGRKTSSSEIIKNNISNNKKMLKMLLILFFVFILVLVLEIFSIKYKNNMIIVVPIVVLGSIVCLIFISTKSTSNKREQTKNDEVVLDSSIKTNSMNNKGIIEDILYLCNYTVYLVKECNVTIIPIVRNKYDNKLIILNCKNNNYKIKDDGFIYKDKQYKIGDEIDFCLNSVEESKNYIRNINFYLMEKEYSTFSVKGYAYMGKWKNKTQIYDTSNNQLLYNVNIDDLQNSLLNSIYTDSGEITHK